MVGMEWSKAVMGDTGPDKLDMSLDDIIKLNKKQRNVKKSVPHKGKQILNRSSYSTMHLKRSSSWRGIPQRSGKAVNRQIPLGRRKVSGPRRRRFQGLITGLAARKALMLQKSISTPNRSSLSHKAGRRTPLLRSASVFGPSEGQQRFMPSLKHSLQLKRNSIQTNFSRIPAQTQQNKEARQATFLFKRGLKVHMQTEQGVKGTSIKRQTQQWSSNSGATAIDQSRIPSTSRGVLTVSIQNPSAKNADSQQFRIRRPPLIPFAVKKELTEKREPPKGVPLEFDINSVGRQTGITLNERFAILKERRKAVASSKGERFVTVG
ncbi:UAP56-interacting factor-like isoform X1 [Pristis pectinata]|uniref:UAP56-interacting factor-like isoform X1 n=1 Tax=Pristis pectinata TaxID=685728 RepID=UPI00223E70F3|nr:UAP56-interacting factor-like isoform X1 [Pristis pectinata]